MSLYLKQLLKMNIRILKHYYNVLLCSISKNDLEVEGNVKYDI